MIGGKLKTLDLGLLPTKRLDNQSTVDALVDHSAHITKVGLDVSRGHDHLLAVDPIANNQHREQRHDHKQQINVGGEKADKGRYEQHNHPDTHWERLH